jgi:hypothetical protein
MLAGHHPYGRQPAEAGNEPEIALQPLAALDPERRAALRAALAWSRAGRPDMAELMRALRREHVEKPVAPAAPASAETPAAIAARLAAPSAVAAPHVPAPAAAPARPARSRLTLLSAVAAGLALVLGILIGRFDSGKPEPVGAVPPPAVASATDTRAAPQEKAVASATTAAPEPRPPATEDAPAEAPVEEGSTGLVFFDAPKMVVSKRAVVAAVPLRHLNRARRAVSVKWRIVEGSARAGRDYAGATSGTETFVEGHSFRILFVPIIENPGATGDRTFTVELTDVTPGASFGPTQSVEVTILGGP